MEKMSRKTIFNIICSGIIVGIILSFSLFFLITAIMNDENTVSDRYFVECAREDNLFSVFDDACLKNQSFYELINVYEYRVFNNVLTSELISGHNGFLFEVGENEHGYNYLDDYTGNMVLSAEQLDFLHKYIEIRRTAYENFGSKYVLAVLPNSQTVYSEYMPDYLGSISSDSMLLQLDRYLEEQGFLNFINLTDAMIEGKTRGQVYNNTENTVNALGAYVAYDEIVKYINSNSDIKVNGLEENYFKLQTRITDGKMLAKKAGLASVIKNKTISISDSNEYIYTLVELFGELETTYTKYEYRDRVQVDSTVLLEFSNEWDKVQLMPYFSSTFERASYRVGCTFNRSAVVSALPDVVVQVIREDELLSLMNADIVASYNDGLVIGQHPYKTSTPTEIATAPMGKFLFCVTGVVEEGSEITLFGDGVHPVTVKEFDGRFFATVEIENPYIANQISISAKVPNKSVSDIVYALIRSLDIPPVSTGAIVGGNSMLYSNDYNVGSIPPDAVLEDFVKELTAEIDGIKQYAPDARFVYAVIPEKISVYNSGLDELLNTQAFELQAKRMLFSKVITNVGGEYVDFIALLREKALNEKLYYQTSDGITDMGNYYMYSELMNVLSTNTASLKPYSLDSAKYTLIRQKAVKGELLERLGMWLGDVTETAVKITVNDKVDYYQDSDRFDITKQFVTYNDNLGENLPVAIVVRDGNTDKMLELMAEHFSVMYVLDKGATEIPPEVLDSISPDYVIYLTPEVNIFS